MSDTGRIKRRRGERGASLVEFAIIAPLLLLMLFGIVELTRLAYAFSEVWTAAREGARYSTTVGDSDTNGIPNFVDCDGIRQAALAKVIVESLTTSDVEVRYQTAGGAAIADCQPGGLPDPTAAGNIDPGTRIRVRVNATFDAVVPLIEGFFDGIVLNNDQVRSVSYGVIGD